MEKIHSSSVSNDEINKVLQRTVNAHNKLRQTYQDIPNNFNNYSHT